MTGATAETILADYISKGQLATELGVDVRTVDRWHVMRQGPARTTIGRKVWYRRSSVVSWLLSRERKVRGK